MLDQEEERCIQQSKFCCPYGAPTFSEGGVDMLSSGKFTVFLYVDGACVGDGGSVT